MFHKVDNRYIKSRPLPIPKSFLTGASAEYFAERCEGNIMKFVSGTIHAVDDFMVGLFEGDRSIKKEIYEA